MSKTSMTLWKTESSYIHVIGILGREERQNMAKEVISSIHLSRKFREV